MRRIPANNEGEVGEGQTARTEESVILQVKCRRGSTTRLLQLAARGRVEAESLKPRLRLRALEDRRPERDAGIGMVTGAMLRQRARAGG